MNFNKTKRGFEIVEFIDLYGVTCSIQESSLATEDALWFGPNKADPKIMASKTKDGGTGWVNFDIPEDVLLTTRAHLSVGHVKNIVKILSNWLDTRSLNITEEV